MNKPKLRMEVELTRLGFIKVEPDFWAWFSIRPERPMNRLDVVLAGAITATYRKHGKGAWDVSRGIMARHCIQVNRPEDVKPALDLLIGRG